MYNYILNLYTIPLLAPKSEINNEYLNITISSFKIWEDEKIFLPLQTYLKALKYEDRQTNGYCCG